MNELQAKQVVGVLAAAFRTDLRGLSDGEIAIWVDVYVAGILDLDHGAAKAAVERLVKSSRFLPRVAEIRAAVVTTDRGQKRSGAEAWGDVIRVMGMPPSAELEGVLIGRRGEGRPRFADQVADRVVDALNWDELRLSENRFADRARFIDAYDVLVEQGRVEAQVSPRAAGPALPARRAPVAFGKPEQRRAIAAAATKVDPLDVAGEEQP